MSLKYLYQNEKTSRSIQYGMVEEEIHKTELNNSLFFSYLSCHVNHNWCPDFALVSFLNIDYLFIIKATSGCNS